MKTNLMNIKDDWFLTGECPGCGSRIVFRRTHDAILVNNWSKRFIDIPGMVVLDRECSNPNCEHSKIEVLGNE